MSSTVTCHKCKSQWDEQAFDALPWPSGAKTEQDCDQRVPAGANPRTEPEYKLRSRNCTGTMPDGSECRSTLSRITDIYQRNLGGFVMAPDGWRC
jgi:hypothetical protein